ncbi:MAG: UDP binding domain-containing protein, partial [bacterium]
LGVAFKKDINDARNSPALKVIEELVNRGAQVSYHDPFVRSVGNGSEFFDVDSAISCMRSVKLSRKLLESQDCVVLLVDHECFNIRDVVKNSKLVVDTKNVTKGIRAKGARIVKI